MTVNRIRWVGVGLLAVGLVVGADPAGRSPLAAVPTALETLNISSRALYKGGREAEVSTGGPIVIASGDELVLRRNGTRVAAKVIPPEYHALKCVSHVTLGTFTHLTRFADKPLPDGAASTLRDYRGMVAAAEAAIDACRFDAETAARQRRIIADTLKFHDKVLANGAVSTADLTRYCRASRAAVQANFAAAARLQLMGTHKQMMAWKAEMTADEWAKLAVVIPGKQTPRAGNAAVQYFARLFDTDGEGPRVVYAEELWDEEKAVALLGTRRIDAKVSEAFFADPGRMFEDVLKAGAQAAADDIFASP